MANNRKIQVKTFSKKNEIEELFASIDIESLNLYAQMMRDRYGEKEQDDE